MHKEEDGSFEKSINKSYIFYVSLISIVTGYAVDDRISIPDMDRVSFFTSVTSRLALGASRHQSTECRRPFLTNNVAEARI
jgi:hypothetical protein